ncbi:PucR family transcriptional regulator ligand-binding domain-containing protein [Cytobacillus suaedae]|nr:PucR family transcriptional regulator ligand-binding domain-containing protein [Cytobacillus suaedae]
MYKGDEALKSYLMVKDILERKHFENVEIIAGEEGLGRLVKWVHVVEIINIRNLLNGSELILSTGVAWKDNHDIFLSLVQQLIDSDAAGLCIEIGTFTSTIPQQVIDLANQSHFPIIVFHKEVPFVEITQDIHTLLIHRQYQMISDLESYSQALNKKLLTIENYIEILKFIHHYLQVQVVLLFSNEEVQFIPDISSSNERKSLLQSIEKNDSSSYSIERNPIQLLGDHYAELIICSDDRVLTEFDHLILDRTATALAQLLLRELYVEEKRRMEETEWLNGWIEGVHTEEEIKEYLSYINPQFQTKGVVVCLIKLESFDQYSSADITYFKLFVRAIFEQQGFSLFAIEKRNTLIFIFLNERGSSTWKKRFKQGMERVCNVKSQIGEQKKKIAIGKYVDDITATHLSYQTALETIRIQERLGNKAESHFYEDLHIYRIISQLNRHLDLHELVLEYLEPIITYDEKYNGKLMETLKIYLSCNGSKQETAKRLYIVRQTLYHRIQKLEKLLGPDFMDHEKRLTIEFMILSYEYLVAARKMTEVEREAY